MSPAQGDPLRFVATEPDGAQQDGMAGQVDDLTSVRKVAESSALILTSDVLKPDSYETLQDARLSSESW